MAKTLNFDLPGFNFFEAENIWTGSLSKDREQGTQLRYQIKPNTGTAQLELTTWQEDVCIEKAQDKKETFFPLSPEGLVQLEAFLGELHAI